MSPFKTTEGLQEEDPILSLAVAFREETRPTKVNLGIGAFRTSEGAPYVLPSVLKAETQLLARKLDHEYLPIEGEAAFLKEIMPLLFGKGAAVISAGRLAAVQSIGDTSALRIGAEYLALQGPKEAFVSEPTWPNHRALFARGGLQVKSYPYFDKAKGTLDFLGMCAAIRKMPSGSIIVLHGCCHNPTGVDPTPEQWRELSTLIRAQRVFPFFDLAYQGFGQGLDEDAWPVRHFAEEGHDLFVAYSCSKNFGLYGERIGALIALCGERETAVKVGRQLKTLVRGSYSTPPLHGARIVATILQTEALHREWEQELTLMRRRIQEMRQEFVNRFEKKNLNRNVDFLRQQHGLFSYGLIQPEQVGPLRKEYGIFLPPNGRMNVAGLTPHNLDYVVEAVCRV